MPFREKSCLSKDITYLGSKYMNPVVDKRDFCEHFGKSYIRKALSKKLIFKGLNLLDGFIDLNGIYIPGKSTLVICSNNTDNFFRAKIKLRSVYINFFRCSTAQHMQH